MEVMRLPVDMALPHLVLVGGGPPPARVLLTHFVLSDQQQGFTWEMYRVLTSLEVVKSGVAQSAGNPGLYCIKRNSNNIGTKIVSDFC
jgi:hypothetical protein